MCRAALATWIKERYTMANESKVKCPYCKRVFLWKLKGSGSEKATVSISCPYCKEQLVLTRDMLRRM